MRFNGEALVRVRNLRMMSQAQLAKKLGKGVNQSVISKWEDDSSTPSDERIEKLAKALNVGAGLLAIDAPTASIISLPELHGKINRRNQ